MTKLLPPSALLFSLVGWGLTVITALNLFSGHFDNRSCQTDCVILYFWSAVAFAGLALLLGLIALFGNKAKVMGGSALVLAVPLAMILAGIIFIGTMYGSM